MKPLQPVNGIRNEEVHHFTPAKIEYVRSPVFMFTGSWVFVLVKSRAVEPPQAMFIFCEVCRHPVYKYADAFVVACINKIAEVVGVAETAGRSKIPCYLVAPGWIVRVFGNRHKLDVRKAHLFYVRDKIFCKLTVGKKPGIPVGVTFPGSGMNLIYRNWLIVCLNVSAVLHPGRIVPFV